MPRDRGPRPSAPSPKWNSLVAAAAVMTAPNRSLATATGAIKSADWQTKVWEMYDTVGELGAGVNWLANGLSRVNLIAARPARGPGDEPTVIVPDAEGNDFTPVQVRAAELVAQIAGGSSGQGQMMHGFGLHLSLTGICWLVAEPDPLQPDSDTFATWHVYSAEELRRPPGSPTRSDAMGNDVPVIEVQEDLNIWRPLHINALVVKCWRKHPRRSWEPDAATRRALPVLTLIDLLTKHIQATALSRLSGAGLLAIAAEAIFPSTQQQTADPLDNGLEPDDQTVEPQEDDFAETLVDYAMTPINDRSAPGATVPLVVRIPGEFVDKLKYLTFSTPFDASVSDIMDRQIRRLATQMDLPPEILLGMSDVNHWTAWQVDESAITIHIEPSAEVVCHALSTGYLQGALAAEGYTPDDIASTMVWYDTTDLTAQPDKSGNATSAYGANAISVDAWLRELGLRVEDKPSDEEVKRRALIEIARAPHVDPGVSIAIYGVLGILTTSEVDTIMKALPAALTPQGGTSGAPVTPTPSPNQPPSLSASINQESLVSACDVIVHRALERAGARLKSAAGRGVEGGAAGISHPNASTLHTVIDATVYADLDQLLAGAWTLVPDVAARCGVAEGALTDLLNAYARALLAAGQEHSYERLAQALGVHAAI